MSPSDAVMAVVVGSIDSSPKLPVAYCNVRDSASAAWTDRAGWDARIIAIRENAGIDSFDIRFHELRMNRPPLRVC
jgi:hypothetical protein